MGIRRPKREENNIAASNVRFRMVKRKAIPVQTLTGPEGSMRQRVPEYLYIL